MPLRLKQVIQRNRGPHRSRSRTACVHRHRDHRRCDAGFYSPPRSNGALRCNRDLHRRYSSAVTWTAHRLVRLRKPAVFTPSGTGTGTCTASSTQAGYTNYLEPQPSRSRTRRPPSPGSPSLRRLLQSPPVKRRFAPPPLPALALIARPSHGQQPAERSPGRNLHAVGCGRWGLAIATSTQAGYTNISGSAPITVTSAPFTITSVTVAANPATITAAQTSQCAATVAGTGSDSSAVTWTATGGTITPAGSLDTVRDGNCDLHCKLNRGRLHQHFRLRVSYSDGGANHHQDHGCSHSDFGHYIANINLRCNSYWHRSV